jgi:uncharacterized surface protein with fasciclin (FAS1) repeats
MMRLGPRAGTTAAHQFFASAVTIVSFRKKGNRMTLGFRPFVVGAMMLSAVSISATAARAADIVDTAVGAGQFKTLVTAVTAAGLVPVLKGKGPYTVFAPTDAAFAALPAGTVEDLLKHKNKAKLAAILKYHVLPGKVKAADVAGKKLTVKTAQGQSVNVDGTALGVQVNDAHVVQADIEASNGVIHVIDKVLLPPAKSAPMHH